MAANKFNIRGGRKTVADIVVRRVPGRLAKPCSWAVNPGCVCTLLYPSRSVVMLEKNKETKVSRFVGCSGIKKGKGLWRLCGWERRPSV